MSVFVLELLCTDATAKEAQVPQRVLPKRGPAAAASAAAPRAGAGSGSGSAPGDKSRGSTPYKNLFTGACALFALAVDMCIVVGMDAVVLRCALFLPVVPYGPTHTRVQVS